MSRLHSVTRSCTIYFIIKDNYKHCQAVLYFVPTTSSSGTYLFKTLNDPKQKNKVKLSFRWLKGNRRRQRGANKIDIEKQRIILYFFITSYKING